MVRPRQVWCCSVALALGTLAGCGSTQGASLTEETPAITDIGPFGGAHPTILVATDPAGRWVAACQARLDTDDNGETSVSFGYHGEPSGDALSPYLFLEPGEGEAIDEFVASSSDGDKIAIMIDGDLVLVDVPSGQRTILGPARTTESRHTRHAPSQLAFNSSGTHALYLRNELGRSQPVLRTLLSGDEVPIPVGDSLVVDGTFVNDGNFVRLLMVREDTNGDGELTYPHWESNAPNAGVCPRPGRPSTTSGPIGDDMETMFVRVGDLTLRSLEELAPDGDAVAILGRSVLARRADGSLVVQDPTGAQRLLAPAECNPFVLAVYSPAERVLVRCVRRGASGEEEASVVLFGEEPVLLDVSEGYASFSENPRELRWIQVGEHLVDLASGRTFELPSDGELIYRFEDRVLHRRGGRVTWMNVSSGRMRILRQRVQPRSLTPVFPRGHLVFAGEFTVNMRSGRLLANDEPAGIAFTELGHRLVLADPEAGRGPLTFRTPTLGPPRRAPDENSSLVASAAQPSSEDPPSPMWGGTETCEIGDGDNARLLLTRLGSTDVSTGDTVNLELTVHNRGAAAMIVEVPTEIAWGHPERTWLVLETAVPRSNPRFTEIPLGWRPERFLRPQGFRRVEVPASQQVSLGAFPLSVLPSAQSGRMQVRVRYRAPTGGCATAVELVSNPIQLNIRASQSAQLATCRAEQRRELPLQRFVENRPLALVPAASGFWLIYRSDLVGVFAGEPWIMARRLDANLLPEEDPIRLIPLLGFALSEMGALRLDDTRVDHERLLLAAAAPDGSAGRVVVWDVRFDRSRPRVVRTSMLPGAERGVVDVRSLTETSWGAALVASGGIRGGPALWRLNRDGTPSQPPIVAAPVFRSIAVGDEDSLVHVWSVLGPEPPFRFRRYDAGGAPEGSNVSMPGQGTPVAAVLRNGRLEIAYQDTISGHDGPLDQMGFFTAVYAADGTRVGNPVAHCSPSPDDSCPGAAIPFEGGWAVATLELGASSTTNARPPIETGTVGVSLSGQRRELSSGRDLSHLQIQKLGNHLAVLWSDSRDDAVCTPQTRCGTEVYGALLNPDGTLLRTPTRLTHTARSFAQRNEEWELPTRCAGDPTL